MSCVDCDKYTSFDVCLSCGSILKSISQDIQKYYHHLENLVEKPNCDTYLNEGQNGTICSK